MKTILFVIFAVPQNVAVFYLEQTSTFLKIPYKTTEYVYIYNFTRGIIRT